MFSWLNDMSSAEIVWMLIGFSGQALFASRFIIQWFKSEQVGRSVIPMAFWYCSIGGGIVLFSYALYRQDPVFIAGQGLGLFVYLRNLVLIFREKKNDADATEAGKRNLADGPQSAQDIVAVQFAQVAQVRAQRDAPTVAQSFAKQRLNDAPNTAVTPEKA